MEFGLFFLMQRDEQWTEQAGYDSALEQMLAAEALGYHSAWIAKHHFNDYGICSCLLITLSNFTQDDE